MKLDGFKKISKLGLDENGLISREFLIPTFYQNVIYAFVRGSKVLYIGQTVDLWGRFDTYRNCVNWRNAKQSNIKKNIQIIEEINKGCLWLYIKRVGDRNMDEVEIECIRKFKPEWNIHFNR